MRHAGRRGRRYRRRGEQICRRSKAARTNDESAQDQGANIAFSVGRTPPSVARLGRICSGSRPVCDILPRMSHRDVKTRVEEADIAITMWPGRRKSRAASDKPSISHLDRGVAAAGADYSAVHKGTPRVAARVHGGAARGETCHPPHRHRVAKS